MEVDSLLFSNTDWSEMAVRGIVWRRILRKLGHSPLMMSDTGTQGKVALCILCHIPLIMISYTEMPTEATQLI